MKVKIVNKSKHPLPNYATSQSAGMDLRANLNESILLKPLQRTLVKTGLFMELPIGYEAQIRPRSGLAAKDGLTVVNSPGTIDSDYRGEIKVILSTLKKQHRKINRGDRIAQIIITPIKQIRWEEVESLEITNRGIGGFGSTGN